METFYVIDRICSKYITKIQMVDTGKNTIILAQRDNPKHYLIVIPVHHCYHLAFKNWVVEVSPDGTRTIHSTINALNGRTLCYKLEGFFMDLIKDGCVTKKVAVKTAAYLHQGNLSSIDSFLMMLSSAGILY